MNRIYQKIFESDCLYLNPSLFKHFKRRRMMSLSKTELEDISQNNL